MKKVFGIITCLVIFSIGTTSCAQKPINLEGCNAYLDKTLKPKDIEHIKNLTYEQLTELHFTLGLYIRNTWIRSVDYSDLVKYFRTIGLNHPDDISATIIDSYWCYLHNVDFDLEGNVKRYQLYWENVAATKKINEQNIIHSEKKLKSLLVDIGYKHVDAPYISIPQRRNGHHVFCNEFIKYRDGYIINSLSTYPNIGQHIGISYNYHYVDLKTNALFRLNFTDFDMVESVIMMDSTLYVSGKMSGELRILQYAHGESTWLGLEVTDTLIKVLSNTSWTKLGVFENKLFALQTNGLYRFDNGIWQTISNSSLSDQFRTYLHPFYHIIIPTENIVMTKNKLYFKQEILQGNHSSLFEWDLSTDTLSELWKKNNINDSYHKEISSFTFLGDTLLVSAQILGKSLLLAEHQNKVELLLLDDKMKVDLLGECIIKLRAVYRDTKGVILIAENGLFKLQDRVITPLIFFGNNEQTVSDGKYKIHFNFTPRSFAVVSKNKYLIGGQFGGLYLVDMERNSVQVLDDNKSIMTMNFPTH